MATEAAEATAFLHSLGWSASEISRLLQGPNTEAPSSDRATEANPKSAAKASAKVPTEQSAAALVIKIKGRLRIAAVKKMPDYLQALITDQQPSPEEQKRFDDYKQGADILRAAEAIEAALVVVATAVNPIVGAVAGVAVAAVSATQEVMAKEIERYIAPWQKKDAGLTAGLATKSMQTIAYSYRGFTSIGYGSDMNSIYGIISFKAESAPREDEFDEYIDGLLYSASTALKIPFLSRYFPINQITEKLPLEDRDNERTPPRFDMRPRIVAQYLPGVVFILRS